MWAPFVSRLERETALHVSGGLDETKATLVWITKSLVPICRLM